MKFGTVALIGRSNVGKSTFLNAVLEEDLAIVSPLPQTTRDALLGVVTRTNAQFAFLDTPGLHRHKNELGRRMNTTAIEVARSADVVVFMTDVVPAAPRGPTQKRPPASGLSTSDRELIERLPGDRPAIAVINKVDLIRNKARLLPLLEDLAKTGRFTAFVPVSIQTDDGVDRVMAEIEACLPEGPPAYDDDTLTDRPIAFFVREYVREQVLLQTGREVPHAVAVTVESMKRMGTLTRIMATIHVEKPGQRAILVGRGGQTLTSIGTAARLRIEALLENRVHLELFVRVTPKWKHVPRQLAELGYEHPGADDGGKSGEHE
jgi:GTPase